MSSRQDQVIIMARGDSSRMKRPKGTVETPDGSGVSFLRKIADLYRRNDLGGIIVTTNELTELYQSLAGADDGFEVCGFAGGGDTARTLSYGWGAIDQSTTHVWAHPIDLPLVADATIMRLKQESFNSPLQVIRPSFNGTIGHPVILPTSGVLDFSASRTWHHGAMRSVIAESFQYNDHEGPLLIAVEDQGVVQDFDEPNDLKGFHS